MTVPRFHVPGASSNQVVPLPREVAHHALGVLRLRAGARLRVFDGQGHEFDGWLEGLPGSLASVRVGDNVPARPESPLRILLALPPLKGDRMELVIQKATELGVAEIWPIVTARTDAAGRPALVGSRRERWARVASGAAEQCGRAVVPRIAEARDLPGMLAASRHLARLAFLESTEAPPIARSLESDRHPGGVVALIGPPGGFGEAETEAICAAGFQRVSLGPRTLRSETAAIVAVSLLQHLWGDLGGPPVPQPTGATAQP